MVDQLPPTTTAGSLPALVLIDHPFCGGRVLFVSHIQCQLWHHHQNWRSDKKNRIDLGGGGGLPLGAFPCLQHFDRQLIAGSHLEPAAGPVELPRGTSEPSLPAELLSSGSFPSTGYAPWRSNGCTWPSITGRGRAPGWTSLGTPSDLSGDGRKTWSLSQAAPLRGPRGPVWVPGSDPQGPGSIRRSPRSFLSGSSIWSRSASIGFSSSCSSWGCGSPRPSQRPGPGSARIPGNPIFGSSWSRTASSSGSGTPYPSGAGYFDSSALVEKGDSSRRPLEPQLSAMPSNGLETSWGFRSHPTSLGDPAPQVCAIPASPCLRFNVPSGGMGLPETGSRCSRIATTSESSPGRSGNFKTGYCPSRGNLSGKEEILCTRT